jgi:hypothetical protein
MGGCLWQLHAVEDMKAESAGSQNSSLGIPWEKRGV